MDSSAASLATRIGLAGLAVAIAFFFRWFIGVARAAWLVRSIPAAPGGTLIGGQVAALTSPKGHRLMQSWSETYNGLYKLRAYWRQVLIIADPFIYDELVSLEREGALEKDFDSGSKAKRNIVSEHTSSPVWKVLRKGVSPAFNTGNLKKYHHHVVYVLNCLIDAIKKGGPDAIVDINDVAQRESFDVIGTVGFGTDFGTRSDITKGAAPTFAGGRDVFSLFTDGMDEMWKTAQNPLRKFLAPFVAEVKAGRASLQKMGEVGAMLLKDVQGRGAPAPDDVTIGAHLLRLKAPGSTQPLSQARLTQEFLAFLLAGSETTGYTISWTLFEVLRHPNVLAKLEAELDQAGLLVTAERPDPRPFTFADINLPYLQACIKESMRLRLAVPFGFRRVALKDIRLSNGVLIPKGMMILSSALASMGSSRYWGPDAREFKPERWLEGDDLEHMERPAALRKAAAAAPAHDGAVSVSGHDKVRKFHPFGDGLRSCVGQNLARMNIPTAVAMLLSNLHLTLDESVTRCEPEELEALRITMQFKNGLPMRCASRLPAPHH